MQGSIRTMRTISSQPLLVDPDIERTTRRNSSDNRRTMVIKITLKNKIPQTLMMVLELG